MYSQLIKRYLLEYYRFNRGMIVGTEVNCNGKIADILAITRDRKTSYEIEIKTSVSDFNADFKKKKRKHFYIESEHWHNPNYMLFCVPYDILDKVENKLPKKYGLLVVGERGGIKTIKRAKKINNSSNEGMYNDLIRRLNNEVVTFYQKTYTRENC